MSQRIEIDWRCSNAQAWSGSEHELQREFIVRVMALAGTHPDGFSLHGLVCNCAGCGEALPPAALRLSDSFRCIGVHAAVGCLRCRMVTVARLRMYDGRMMLRGSDGKWRTSYLAARRVRWWRKAWRWLTGKRA